jgi:hypothetical protein
VRDPIEKTEAVKEKGQPTGEYQTIIVDQGVPDKRLLVLEGEFVTALKVMERDGNTLSSQVRLAWDHGNLQSLTKNSPAKATGAHISILGHVTRDELLRYLNDTETGNGFGNRFLWLCARRSKILPEGGGAPDYGELAFKLQAALDTARRLGAIERDDDAKRGWAEIYGDLSEGKQGLIGAVTARAEAQVTRLAALYAAFDGSKVINVSHLCAALAIWTYCEQSVAYIFGDATGDSVADRIVAALRANPEGMDKTDISRALGTHITGTRIDQALTVLLTTKLARRERIPPESGIGRPREVWYAA